VPRVRHLAVAAVLAALVLPAAATAAATPATLPAPIAAAASVAQRYWGAVPCGGHLAIVAFRPLVGGAEPGTDAWVTFGSPLGADDLAAAPDTYTNCTIALGRARWPTTASLRDDWDMLCMTMVHEMGHLLGHAHDSTPGSVMAPIFIDYSDEPALCRAGLRAATANGASRSQAARKRTSSTER